MNDLPLQPLVNGDGPTLAPTATSCLSERRRWVEAAPVLAGLASMGFAELGLQFLAEETTTRFGLSHAGVWLIQSLITGQLTILIITAALLKASRPWLEPNALFCGAQAEESQTSPTSLFTSADTLPKAAGKPSTALDRGNVFISTALTCLGWTLWFVLRASGAFMASPRALLEQDILLVLFILALGILAATVPFLWHAIHVQQSVSGAGYLAAVTLAAALCVQCCTTAAAPRDPAHLYTFNSALIVGSIVVWLISISRHSSTHGTEKHGPTHE